VIARSKPPNIAVLVHRDDVPVPKGFTAAFPGMKIQSVRLGTPPHPAGQLPFGNLAEEGDDTVPAIIHDCRLRRGDGNRCRAHRVVVASHRSKEALGLPRSSRNGKDLRRRRVAQVLVSESRGHVEFLQFHPAYTYEDFVQGIRAVSGADGTLRYDILPGRFLKFCERRRRLRMNLLC